MIISTFECKSFVQNSDTTHKIIQSMFHCNRAYHNVLYMVIGKNLIIQSDIEPYEIPDSLRLMNSRNCDEMVAKINAGDVVKLFNGNGTLSMCLVLHIDIILPVRNMNQTKYSI